MADYWALSSDRVWSNVSNWLTGTTPGQMAGALPGPLDDVYANGRFITIDVNANASLITTRAGTNSIAGGGFFINSGVILSAVTVLQGTTTCLTFLSAAPNACTVFANISSSSTVSGRTVINNSTGTINIVGNITGGSGLDNQGVRNVSTGTIQVTGNVVGGSGTSSANDTAGPNGIHCLEGNVTVVGNVSSGTGSQSYGIYYSGTGTVNVVGDISNNTGGTSTFGIFNASTSTGTINITGNLFNFGVGSCINNSSSIGSIVNIFGNVFGGLNNQAINNTGARANTNIIGNIFGGSTGLATSIINNGGLASTVSITGNIFANNIFNTAAIVNGNTFKTRVTIFGNISGGSQGNGINNNNESVVVVNGNVFGGAGSSRYGINNVNNGLVTVNGIAIGGSGSGAFALLNSSSGGIAVTRAVANNFGIGSTLEAAATPGLNNTSLFGSCYVEELSCGSRGAFPTSGPNIYIVRKSNNQANFIGAVSANLTTIQSPSSILLFSSLTGVPGSLAPLVSDVRFNTLYDLSSQRGILFIPSTQTVLCGIAVDTPTNFGSFFTNLPRAWQTQLSAITGTNTLGTRFKNIITLPETSSIWVRME